jgi:hypothetical protein
MCSITWKTRLLQELLKAIESGDAVQVKAQLKNTDVNFQDEVCKIPHRELSPRKIIRLSENTPSAWSIGPGMRSERRPHWDRRITTEVWRQTGIGELCGMRQFI